jgi:hypothetical protein
VLRIGSLILSRVRKQRIPRIKRIGFVLPEFFRTEIADGSAEDGWFFGKIWRAARPAAGQFAGRNLPYERILLRRSGEKATQVLLLFFGKVAYRNRGDGRSAHDQTVLAR